MRLLFNFRPTRKICRCYEDVAVCLYLFILAPLHFCYAKNKARKKNEKSAAVFLLFLGVCFFCFCLYFASPKNEKKTKAAKKNKYNAGQLFLLFSFCGLAGYKYFFFFLLRAPFLPAPKISGAAEYWRREAERKR